MCQCAQFPPRPGLELRVGRHTPPGFPRLGVQQVRLALRSPSAMELVGVLSNHEIQGPLARLVKKLAAVRASGEPRPRAVACRQRPRRPGWVLEAVVQVLADRGEPMRAKDIHAAVETSLGAPVAWSSVKASLAANVSGTSPRFVRMARGRYVLVG